MGDCQEDERRNCHKSIINRKYWFIFVGIITGLLCFINYIRVFMNFKKSMLKAAALFAGSALFAVTAMAEVNPKPFTVPEISSWKGGEGHFVPTPATRIVTDGKDGQTDRIAAMFARDYTALTGNSLIVETGAKARKGDISFRIKEDKKADAESYTLVVRPDGVTVTAPAWQGLFWATRTLLQMSELSDDLSLPAGTATDRPEFSLRGFMIDCGRKYIPMEYLYVLVDAMSYYKMNTLHVHLNDNGFKYYFDDDWDKTQAAFRMESGSFPELTARDGSYTKAEFRKFISDAALKGVEIIPEIDIPAHSLAFTRLKPELAGTGQNGRDHLDINKPETHEFLETLLEEYIGGDDPVFAGPRFHIGTDEYQGDSLTLEQFRAFTDRYIKFTEKHGKKPAIWGSLTHAKGQTPVQTEGVLMYGWSNGYADPADMIRQGYRMVSIPDSYVYIVPVAGYYYDYLNNPFLYEKWTPANIGGAVFTGDDLRQIEGGMFAVWNDHPNNGITVKDIHHRIMHSLPVIAAKTWNADRVTVPFAEFDSLSSRLSEAPGLDYLARCGHEPAVVLELAEVAPGSVLPIAEIGYPYTVEFEIEGAEEAKGTKLFESPYATFWLSDPVSGNLAFSREEHLNTFRQNILPGEKLRVRITGTNKGTALYVNDRLVDDLNIRWVSYNGGKNKMAQVRTLFFPLQNACDFNSRITNLKVSNF